MADEESTTPGQAEPGDGDVAAENRRRLREALERKRGVQHPDDRARGGSGVRGSAPHASGRDFTHRRSG